MVRLDERKWKPITLSDIFVLKRGKEKKDTVTEGGLYPFVSAKISNNGIRMFIDKPTNLLPAGSISLNSNGDGGTGFGYYQPYDYAIDVNTTALIPRDGILLNKYSELFIIACFGWMHNHFGNALPLSMKRAAKVKIMLPVTDDGQPDYQFMEDYIHKLMSAKRERYRKYVEKRMESLELPGANKGGYSDEMRYHKWKPYRLSALGTIESGRDIYALNRFDGDIPYITSGSQNNGIGYFVSNRNDTYDKGYIAFNRNGAIGLAFYHPYWSIMSNDCRKIHITEADENSYVGIFVATVITMQSKSFSYSRKLGTGRANKLQIMLPVTDDDQPDYAFMESFGKQMMLNKYKQYLCHLNNIEQ